MMHEGGPADTVEGMQAIRRLTGGDPGVLADAAIGLTAAGLIAVAAWGQPRLIGSEAIAGPPWLLAVLPLWLGVALMLRRRAPLVMWLAVWAGIGLVCLLAEQNLLRGLAWTYVVFSAAYALGAHASLRRAVAGLVLTAPVVAVLANYGGLELAFNRQGGNKPAVALVFVQLLAFWLAGVFVHARRRAAAEAVRSAALQAQAEQAVAAERARIARELHDIVAHHLAVVVLYAAGARAAGRADPETLAEIEDAGRRALTETRRLFGVLRDPGEAAGRAPQPGIGELPALAGTLRTAGLPVALRIDGDHGTLPPAVTVSAYRIVQEALTNVLKHAGPASAQVTIGCAADAVTIEVTDDGPGTASAPVTGGGHGLAGMRERVALFGGEVAAGPRPGGGFAVRARLPAGEPS
jgi:signal transduction histidine kinase